MSISSTASSAKSASPPQAFLKAIKDAQKMEAEEYARSKKRKCEYESTSLSNMKLAIGAFVEEAAGMAAKLAKAEANNQKLLKQVEELTKENQLNLTKRKQAEAKEKESNELTEELKEELFAKAMKIEFMKNNPKLQMIDCKREWQEKWERFQLQASFAFCEMNRWRVEAGVDWILWEELAEYMKDQAEGLKVRY